MVTTVQPVLKMLRFLTCCDMFYRTLEHTMYGIELCYQNF